MKFLVFLCLLMFSVSSFSHCGACGEGSAEDHKAKGEDDSHHKDDHKYVEEDDKEEDETEEDFE